MKCSNCGFENRPDARFCKQCGQPLAAQGAPPPGEMLCPACGASYKPGARFCSRCGNPLTTGAMPSQPPTQPSMPPIPPSYPSGAGIPPFQQPPAPVAAPYPSRRIPTVVWVLGVMVLLLCIGFVVVAVFFLGPQLGLPVPRGKGPTATPPVTTTPTEETKKEETPSTAVIPTPDISSFAAQVTLSTPTLVISTGQKLTITVTVANTGGVAIEELRCQLVGEWENRLGMVTEPVVVKNERLGPGQSTEATFELEAREPGEVSIRASVTMKISGTDVVKAVNSKEAVKIQIQ